LTHSFRLLVFDFDGTLADSQHLIVQAMSEAFARFRLPPPPPAAVRQVIGLKLEHVVAELLPDGAEAELAARVAEGYRKVYFGLRAQPDCHEPLFPGVREGIAQLDRPDVCLGIATGKSRRGLMASLERHGLRHHFTTVQTADDGPGKPHPELLRRAMADAGAGPRETVLVGDTTFDMEMAVNAGVLAIGVAWGYHNVDELRGGGAAGIVEAFRDLPDTLAMLKPGHP